MSRLIPALALVLLLAGPAGAGTFEDGLARFSEAAAAKDPEAARTLFRRAATAWESLAESGAPNARLQTNIGNARAFAGDLGEAVLAYRRALLIDPGNDRARDSLDAIRDDLGIADRGDNAGAGLLRTLFFWHESLTPAARRALFAAAWIAGFALLLFGRGRRGMRLAGAAALVAALALLASLIVSDVAGRDASDAVLIVRTEGRAGDGAFYSPSHTAPLPAGAELRILQRRPHDGGWVHARLRDGTRTWLPEDRITRLIPR